MRRSLLAAALDAFAEHGYEAMSVRELARRLGVSHNLVHHHYGSKWDLWKAALEHGLASSGRDLIALLESNARESDWEVANRQGIEGAVALFARTPAVAKIMADESARGGARLDLLFGRYIEPFARLLENLLAGSAREDKPRIEPRAALLFLFGGLTAPFALAGLAAKLDGTGPIAKRDLDGFAATVAELTAHGLAPAGRGRRQRMTHRTTSGAARRSIRNPR